MTISLEQLRHANEKRHQEWCNGQQIDLSFRGNELAGETGEACNVIKKLERIRLGLRGSKATVDDLAEELSDIIICVDLIAMDLNIDLGQAVKNKFNKTSEKYGLNTKIS